jgi:hypothetical protein
MRSSSDKRSNSRRTAFALAVVCAFAAHSLLAGARGRSASIKVVNNSEREIINLYLAHADSDDWGADLLPDSTLKTGQSFTISDVACDQPQIKVVAEDKDSCFLSTVVSCGDAVTWTITKDTAAECDGH